MIYDVAVVGSGFSAIAVTIHLMRLLPPSHSIAVVGDDPGFGRGTAYRTEFYLHRLNVPAGRMSVFADQPEHFVEWLRKQGRAVTADDFASRGDYGLYLRDTLASLLRSRQQHAKVDFIKAKATGCVERFRVGTVFQLDNTGDLTTRAVVLCLGVGNARLPVDPKQISVSAAPHIVENPWRLSWLSRVSTDDSICILGSGLTMIDQVLALRSHGHRGRIDVLSRRGLVPHPHLRRRTPASDVTLPEDGRGIAAILKSLRRQVTSADDWRGVMDGLRPKTQALWQQLPPVERARFLRHALPWWNIHRHRISPAVFEQFQALLDDGSVVVRAGFLKSISAVNGKAEIGYRPRGGQSAETFSTDWIVNCTGMERAGVAHSPLLTEMQKAGLILADEQGLGIAVDRHSRVLDANGQGQQTMYAVGALTAGQFWEITAVPDIRVQAGQVAQMLAADSLSF